MHTLMIAEDNQTIRQELEELFRQTGRFNVVSCVATGREAVEAFEAGPVDIVLMDIEMESPDAGIQAARHILSRHPDAEIVYLTSHDEESTIVTAMASGAKDFIVKDPPWSSLEDRLAAVLDGQANLDARVQRLVMDEYRRLRASEESLLYFIHHLSSLTGTERELVSCFLEGLKVRQIAQRRCVEPVTVKSQIRTLLQKLGLSRTSEIVALVRQLKVEHLFRS